MEILLSVLLACVALSGLVNGHGGLLEPPSRSLAWRYGFDAPINYDWMSLYCGGFHKFQQSGGKCGLCGDPYDGPYEQDRGGVYDTGIIVRHYPAGLREIEVKTEITAHHKGYITFKLCPNNENQLTSECLDRYPLVIREAQQQGDPYKFYPPKEPKLHELHIQLPQGVICDRCVLQWKYTAGNSMGTAPDGSRCLGCGLQETFINCADISIGGTVDKISVSNDTIQPGPGHEIVLPNSPNIASIIDSDSSNSFSDVLSAIGQSNLTPPSNVIMPQQHTEVQQTRPHIAHIPSESVRPVQTISDLDRSGDLPGLTREEIDTSRSKGMGIMRDVAARARALNMMVGLDIFGNRLPLRDSSDGVINNVMTGQRDITSPPMLSRDEIMRMRANQHNAAGSMISHSGSLMSHTPSPTQSSDMLRNSDTHNQNSLHMPPIESQSVGSSSLIGSLTNAVSQVRQNIHEIQNGHRMNIHTQRANPTNGKLIPTIHNTIRQPNVLTNAPSSQSASQSNDGRTLQRSQSGGMTSHRAAVRRDPGLETHDFSTSAAHTLVPDHLQTIHTRQDISNPNDRRQHSNSLHSRNGWFSNSQATAQNRRMQAHDLAMAKTEPRDRASSLPRRIVVHNMLIAQHLLRKYPQLRGRVFLSREAHVNNTLTHVVNKYARRQRW